MVQFYQSVSEESVYLRYAHMVKSSHLVAHEQLTRICFIDYDREMALVADYKNPVTKEHEILGVGRLSKLPGTNEGEFAMLVSDKYQHQGLGTELLKRLVQVGRDEQLSQITADILPDNQLMQRVCEKVGFKCDRHYHQDMVQATLQVD